MCMLSAFSTPWGEVMLPEGRPHLNGSSSPPTITRTLEWIVFNLFMEKQRAFLQSRVPLFITTLHSSRGTSRSAHLLHFLGTCFWSEMLKQHHWWGGKWRHRKTKPRSRHLWVRWDSAWACPLLPWDVRLWPCEVIAR